MLRIKSFKIEKLFNEFDYTINFSTMLTFLTAPNGYGKSTILGLINAFATGNLYFINKVEFRSIEIQFDNGELFSIIRKKTKNKTTSIYRYKDIEIPKIFSNEINESEASFVATVFPFLTRITPSLWRHNQTGEIYSLDQIYERFGQHPVLRRQFSLGPWYDELRQELSVKFIGTDRLVSNGDNRIVGDFSVQGPSISSIAKMVKSRIDKSLLDYFNQSRLLESTFANRLMNSFGEGTKISFSDIEKRMSQIKEYEKRYLKLGLINQHLQVQMDDDQEKESAQSLNVLDLYLDDFEKKYEYLNDLANQLEVFITSLNNLFEHKHVEVSMEKGFTVVRNKDNERLPLNSLSSGEQHLIVLLGTLMFGIRENSFVLIDEPEISLHPFWLERITSIFENIQSLRKFRLFVATHSPLLIGERWENTIELAEQVRINA